MLEPLAIPRAPFPRTILGRELHVGHDNFAAGRGLGPNIDFFFFNSRGISQGYETSFARMLIEEVAGPDASYLCVVRRLELTVFASLCNFAALTPLHARVLVTNLGFVDLTPKKAPFVDEVSAQCSAALPGIPVGRTSLGSWMLSNGVEEDLGSITLDTRHADQVARALLQIGDRVIPLGTPVVSPDIAISNRRPPAFFGALGDTAQFLSLLARPGLTLVQPGPFDSSLTYDAVHYTPTGNRQLFRLLQEKL